jgi:hypothetical protein
LFFLDLDFTNNDGTGGATYTGANATINLFTVTVPQGPATPTVPEPTTVALFTLGGLTLAGWRRWKGKRPQSAPAA